MHRRMPHHHLRQRVADGREDLAVRRIGERLVEERIVKPSDGVGESRLRVAQDRQHGVLRLVRANVRHRHAAGAVARRPLHQQPLRSAGDAAKQFARVRQVADRPRRVIHNARRLRDHARGGNVRHLIVSLDQMIALTDVDTVIIPGHGPLARRADLIAWRGTIATAVERVSALKEAGRTVEQAKDAKPLAGLSNNPQGFIGDDAFVESIWGSLEAHGH